MNAETWGNKLLTGLRRRLQTRTRITDEAGLRQSRQQGTVQAYRRLTAVLLTVQLHLWAATGYDRAGQAIWQAAAGLGLPALLLWLLARMAWKKNIRPRRFEIILLIPCLMLDASALLLSLMSLLRQLMPSYPMGVLKVVIPALLIAGAMLSRTNGAAYGLGLWRWLLIVLLATVLFGAHRGEGLAQMFPLMGNGVRSTLSAGYAGLGSLWLIPLLFLLPSGQREQLPGKKHASGASFVLIPLLFCLAFCLTLSLSAPWRPDESLTIGQKLLAVSRSSRSMPLVGLGALLWLLSLMIAFTATLQLGAKLLSELQPKSPAPLAAMLVALPSLVMMALPRLAGSGQGEWPRWVMSLFAGRYWLALGCVLWGWGIGVRRRG